VSRPDATKHSSPHRPASCPRARPTSEEELRRGYLPRTTALTSPPFRLSGSRRDASVAVPVHLIGTPWWVIKQKKKKEGGGKTVHIHISGW